MVVQGIGAPEKSVVATGRSHASVEQIPAMLQNLWTARPQQQTGAACAADVLAWPPGQVVQH